MKTIDLHTHSTCSDGSMTPSQLVRHAKEAGLSAIALSDHDSISGVAEAVEEGKRQGVEVIPAVELSAQSDTETHILGYFIDITNKELLSALQYAKQVRYEREVETCEKLNNIGFEITMHEVEEIAETDILCRAHFAKVMVKKGYVSSVKEAFEKYLNVGKPAYSGKQALTDTQAVELINNAGGIAFLAHLHLTKKPLPELKEFLIRLKNAGLAGVEGYYTDYTPETEQEYRSLASELGLVLSGGTDFHGAFKPHIAIGRGYGNLEIPYEILEKMKKYHQNNRADYAFRKQRKELV
ncbi:MAG: PHP domain-containing protein [Eubacteriales bacterium]|jgi:predicted metal-dependent phosphoesterase TrpH